MKTQKTIHIKKAVKKQLNDVTEKYKTTYRMESLESDMQTREKAKKEASQQAATSNQMKRMTIKI